MPMDRCTANAAGGTSHRLNDGDAIVRSLERSDGRAAVDVEITWSWDLRLGA